LKKKLDLITLAGEFFTKDLLF